MVTALPGGPPVPRAEQQDQACPGDGPSAAPERPALGGIRRIRRIRQAGFRSPSGNRPWTAARRARGRRQPHTTAAPAWPVRNARPLSDRHCSPACGRLRPRRARSHIRRRVSRRVGQVPEGLRHAGPGYAGRRSDTAGDTAQRRTGHRIGRTRHTGPSEARGRSSRLTPCRTARSARGAPVSARAGHRHAGVPPPGMPERATRRAGHPAHRIGDTRDSPITGSPAASPGTPGPGHRLGRRRQDRDTPARRTDSGLRDPAPPVGSGACEPLRRTGQRRIGPVRRADSGPHAPARRTGRGTLLRRPVKPGGGPLSPGAADRAHGPYARRPGRRPDARSRCPASGGPCAPFRGADPRDGRRAPGRAARRRSAG